MNNRKKIIFIIIILIVGFLGFIYWRNRIYTRGLLYRSQNHKAFNEDFIRVKFQHDTDIQSFAKRYKIPFEKIEAVPDSDNIYRVPTQDYNILGAIEVYKKDPGVIWASLEIYYSPF